MTLLEISDAKKLSADSEIFQCKCHFYGKERTSFVPTVRISSALEIDSRTQNTFTLSKVLTLLNLRIFHWFLKAS